MKTIAVRSKTTAVWSGSQYYVGDINMPQVQGDAKPWMDRPKDAWWNDNRDQ